MHSNGSSTTSTASPPLHGAVARCVSTRRPRFDDLLSVDAVDRLLESARRPGFRVVRDGRTVSPSEYTRTVRMGGTSLDDAADRHRIAGLFEDGATLVLQGLERTHEPLRTFTRQLSGELSHAVQANAYLSPGDGAKGLGRHADVHDVFVVQLDGAKCWDVEGLDELRLEAGDVLYIPSGTHHLAWTEGGPSLHLTLGVAVTTYRDVLRRAVDAAPGAGGALDRRLPLGFAAPGGDGSLGAAISAAMRELIDHLEQLGPDQVAGTEQRRIERRLASRRRLRPLFDAACVTHDTRIRLAPGRVASLSTDEDQMLVDLGDLRVRMPVSALDALRELVEASEVRVGELAGLNAESQLVVARRLVGDGVAEIVPD